MTIYPEYKWKQAASAKREDGKLLQGRGRSLFLLQSAEVLWFICASVNVGREFTRAKNQFSQIHWKHRTGMQSFMRQKDVFKGEVMLQKEDECGCLHLM